MKRLIRITSQPVAPKSLHVCCEDVTRVQQAEARLRESEERHDLAMRSMNEGVYDWDIANGSIFYSDRCYAALGMRPGDFEGVTGWAIGDDPVARKYFGTPLRQPSLRARPRHGGDTGARLGRAVRRRAKCIR